MIECSTVLPSLWCLLSVQDKNKKVKVSKETVNASAVYEFEAKRKR
jgi:hypothetical protein